MAVKIGHSSIDENGKGRGGAAGDQTKKEVCIRNYYKDNWSVVLRPNNPALAEGSAVAVEQACANNNIGYDMNQRNTLNTEAKKVKYDLSKVPKCECDCSSLMHVAAIAGGANLKYGSNGATTRTMEKLFVDSGDYTALKESKYLTSDKYLKRGDILVEKGSHTVMVLGNGSGVMVEAVPKPSTQSDTKVDYAKSFDKKYDRPFITTGKLHLRRGATTTKKSIVVMPAGTHVRCHGYYSLNGSTPWLLVEYYNSKGDKYTGFCSSKYLK